jgi:hypothetical protein
MKEDTPYKTPRKILLTTKEFRFIQIGNDFEVQARNKNSLGETFYSDTGLDHNQFVKREKSQVYVLLKFFIGEK